MIVDREFVFPMCNIRLINYNVSTIGIATKTGQEKLFIRPTLN